MIRDEDGLLTGYVYIDIAGRDPNGYVEEAARLLKDKVKLPPGYAISWSGQYEAAQRVKQRLLLVVPLTLFLIFLLLYMNTRSITKTMLIILAVPFSAVGAIWFLYLLGYNMSIAVWVGLIALLGVDAETGIFMLLYLDLAYAQAKAEGRLKTLPQLHDAIIDGAAKRIRPKFMTAATLLLGLIPIMWSTGDRGRRHETHRRPHDRRHLHLFSPGADGLPGHLRDLEMEFRGEKGGSIQLGRKKVSKAPRSEWAHPACAPNLRADIFPPGVLQKSARPGAATEEKNPLRADIL